MNSDLEPVQKALRDLSKSLKSLPANPPPKQVHKLRTSARRVEAIAAALPQVEAKTSRRLIKSIEPLRKTAGRVRDMDVLVANLRKLARDASGDSLARLIDHLQSIRSSGAEELQHKLARERKKARHNVEQFAREAESALPSNGTGAHASGHAPHSLNGRRGNGVSPTAKRLAQ